MPLTSPRKRRQEPSMLSTSAKRAAKASPKALATTLLKAKRRPPRPAVDDRLVMPETRYEVIAGKVRYVPPSDEPHGSRHSKVSALLEAYAAHAYDVASAMLTRTSEKTDMAPDASVYPAARAADTGGRQLEELAFEVVSTESLGHAARKARALSARGVRRVFAIDVERRRALTWSRETGNWEILPPDGAIEDPTLVLPLPIRALVEAAKADDAVAQALLVKQNPVLNEALATAEACGEARGMRLGKIEALLAMLAGRGLDVSREAEERLRAERDEARADAWLRRAGRCQRVDELFEK
jgi:Uma2 family endonuclease